MQCKIVSLRARRSGKLSRDLTSKLIAPTCTTPPQTAVFPPGGILPPSSFHKTQEKQPGLKQDFVFVHGLQIAREHLFTNLAMESVTYSFETYLIFIHHNFKLVPGNE